MSTRWCFLYLVFLGTLAQGGKEVSPRLFQSSYLGRPILFVKGCEGSVVSAVTGSDFFPLRGVLKSLRLDSAFSPDQIPFVAVSGELILQEHSADGVQPFNFGEGKARRILGLGEGYNSLFPFLQNQGNRVWAVDLWYDEEIPESTTALGKMARDFQKEHRDWLLAGRVDNLRHLKKRGKAADITTLGPFDWVLSHQMYDLLTDEEKKGMIRESLRVATDRGLVAIAFYQPRDSPELAKPALASFDSEFRLLKEAIRLYELDNPKIRVNYRYYWGSLVYGAMAPGGVNDVGLFTLQKTARE